jgi:hypothetical protein
MTAEYFELMGLMFGVYCFARFIFWLEMRPRTYIPRPLQPGDEGKAINTTALSERLQHVREDYAAGLAHQSPDFKRALAVERKREEIAKLAFFQEAPPPETPEEEHGLNLMFV